MLIIDSFAHITLRGRITWLLLFSLCWYCCPSVLYIAFFFAVLAFFSDNSVITDFSWTMTIFFFLSWFNIVLSLIPITVYVTVKLYHDHQRRLFQKANNAYSTVHSHYGSGIPSVPPITQVARPFIDVSSASTNTFSHLTSGFAMLTNRSVSVCDASSFRHYQEVSDDYKQRWIFNNWSDTPHLSIDIFHVLTAYVSYYETLKYCQRSLGIDSLVSRMTKLSLIDSSLEQAPLVRAPPIDDGLSIGSGDRSSLCACHCSGIGRTALGSCSCLGHVCPGPKCACILNNGNSNAAGVVAVINGSDLASTLSGFTRACRVSANSFIMVMNHLEEQLSRLSLTGNDRTSSVTTSSVGNTGNSSHSSTDSTNSRSSNLSGLISPPPSVLDVGYALSEMMERCLSITDNVSINRDVDINQSNNDFVDVIDAAKSITNTTPADEDKDGFYNSNGVASYVGSGANRIFVDDDFDDRGIVHGSESGADEESGYLSAAQTGGRNQVFLRDVDTNITCSSRSYDSSAFEDETQNIHSNNIPSNNSIVSGDDSFYGDDDHSHQSHSSNYDETSIANSVISSQVDNGISDDSSSGSVIDYSAQYDYEDSYNPFQSDDDNDSTGTDPLYSGTAVFNDETAFGTF